MRKILVVMCSFFIVFGICTALAFHPQEVQAVEVFTVSMKLSPDNLVIHSIGEGDWLTAHVDIPYSSVDCLTLELTRLSYDDSIPVKYAKADLSGDLVAKFDLSDVKSIVIPPSETLLLCGKTTDGVQFCAADFIRVK
jgi:hypothetical protein